MEGSAGPERRTRRSFLDFLLGASVVGGIGTVVYPVLRYLKPLPVSGSGGPIKLDASEKGQLEKERFVIVRAGAERVLVLKDTDDELRALSARCTHEGGTVRYETSESVIWCACHNARFDLDGRVLSGPPPTPLPRFKAQLDESGDVVVSLQST
jgi:cytochrome b6-f complex iron-sulfur subunit